MTWFLFRKPILEASVVTTRAEEVLSEKSFQKTVYPTLEPSKKSAPAHENPQTLEQSPFDQFKDLCLKDGLLDSQESHDSWPRHIGIDDNPSLMRFLVACKLKPHAALTHFQAAHSIRRANRIDEVYDSLDVGLFAETQMLYPTWTGRRDKRGQPLCVLEVSRITSATLTAHEKSSRDMAVPKTDPRDSNVVHVDSLRACAVHDELTRFIMPLCSRVKEISGSESYLITKQTVIADISGLSLSQLWSLRGHLERFNKLLAISYPDILDRVLVIGAPTYVSTILSWVKKWVDPVTMAKLQVVPASQVHSTLESFIDVTNIPRKYGGELDFEVGMEPKLDEEIHNVLDWCPSCPSKYFPRGPIRWDNSVGGSKMALAVGSVRGAKRHEQVATLL